MDKSEAATTPSTDFNPATRSTIGEAALESYVSSPSSSMSDPSLTTFTISEEPSLWSARELIVDAGQAGTPSFVALGMGTDVILLDTNSCAVLATGSGIPTSPGGGSVRMDGAFTLDSVGHRGAVGCVAFCPRYVGEFVPSSHASLRSSPRSSIGGSPRSMPRSSIGSSPRNNARTPLTGSTDVTGDRKWIRPVSSVDGAENSDSNTYSEPPELMLPNTTKSPLVTLVKAASEQNILEADSQRWLLLASGDTDGTVIVWKYEPLNPFSALDHSLERVCVIPDTSMSASTITALSFNESGDRLAVRAGSGGDIKLWNISLPIAPRCIFVLKQSRGLVAVAAFGAGVNTGLCLAMPEGKLKIAFPELDKDMSQNAGVKDKETSNFADICECTKTSPVMSNVVEGRLAVSDRNSNNIMCINISDPICPHYTLCGHQTMVVCLQFNLDDGSKLVSSSFDGNVVVWDTSVLTDIHVKARFHCGFRGPRVHFNASGTIVSSCSHHQFLSWEAGDGKLSKILELGDVTSSSFAYAPSIAV
jgi:WD40 repeat protein